ncbi:MAG: LysR family transcriptional regulator [Litorimonas sp.]
MNLRQIEIFNAVYLKGSISAAARSLNVSQPTVSKILKRLEDQLGFTLFERAAGRFHPSERANTLFETVEPIFEQLSQLQILTRRLASDRSGHLRFAMTPAFSLEVAPKAISRFSKAHPDVTLEAETLHGTEMSKRILQDEIDVGLVFDAPRLTGIQAERIATTGFVCVSPVSQPLLEEGPVQLADLSALPLIDLNSKSVLGRRLRDRLQNSTIEARRSPLIVETYHLAKRLVRQGAGVAIIDAITALSGDQSGLRFHAVPDLERIGVDLVTSVGGPKIILVNHLKAFLSMELQVLTRSDSHKALVHQ